MAERKPVAAKPVPRIEGAEAQRTLGPIDGTLGVTAPTEDSAACKRRSNNPSLKRPDFRSRRSKNPAADSLLP
jgi:hypothetical protein